MKTAEELVKYIDHYMEVALERPSMYASSPQSLEDSFFLLVTILDFLYETKPANQTNSYQAFLQSKGFGVGHYTRKYYPQEKLMAHDRQVFGEFATFFREFLDRFRCQIRGHIDSDKE
jgi:hypothetical protein